MRVYTKVKSNRGKPYTCTKCGKVIEPGTTYHEWSFRYGGDRRKHAACGRPKQSELTQSKMSGVYASVEAAEEAINGATTVDDIKSALDTCAEEVRRVAEEYSDAAEAMGAAGESSISAERAEALNDFADTLENVDLPEEDDSDDEEEDAESDDSDDSLEDARSAAMDALGELSV